MSRAEQVADELWEEPPRQVAVIRTTPITDELLRQVEQLKQRVDQLECRQAADALKLKRISLGLDPVAGSPVYKATASSDFRKL